MKKNLFYSFCIAFFIFILSNAQITFSKNWELFPPNAKLWCKSSDGRINSISADSLISENNYLFNTKLLDSMTKKCYDEIYEYISNKEIDNNNYRIFENQKGVIIDTNYNSVYYHHDERFYLKKSINLNEIDSQGVHIKTHFDTLCIDRLTFKCIKSQTEIINDKLDSVKEISISSQYFPNKNTTIILSKNHGLRKFFNFYLLFKLDHDITPENFDVIGYESPDESFDYKPEDISRKIFNWKVGDIRIMEYFEHNTQPLGLITYLDSVVDVISKGDELKISFDRVYKDKFGSIIDKGIIIEKYNLKDFNNYFNEYDQFAVLEGFKENYDNSYSIFINEGIKPNKDYGIESNLLLFTQDMYYLQPDCKVGWRTEYGMDVSYVPGPGLVKTYFYGFSTIYVTLLGYRQGDKIWGFD